MTVYLKFILAIVLRFTNLKPSKTEVIAPNNHNNKIELMLTANIFWVQKKYKNSTHIPDLRKSSDVAATDLFNIISKRYSSCDKCSEISCFSTVLIRWISDVGSR